MHTMTTPVTPTHTPLEITTETLFPSGLHNSETTTVHIYDVFGPKLVSVIDDTDFSPYLTYTFEEEYSFDGDELYNITLKVVAITVSANLITVLLPSGKSKGIYISTTDYSVLKIV